jgi:dihydroflavonol-4-reductase
VILVTGATGFLGHNMMPLLAQAGLPLRAVVRPTSKTGFLRDLGVDVVCCELTDRAALARAMEGCEIVVHGAGLFRFWFNSDTAFYDTNARGTANMLGAAQDAGVRRFIYISTVVVVGHPQAGIALDENHPCTPQDPYQKSKLQAENLALAFGERSALEVVVLRPGAFYGPWGRYAFNRLFFEDPLTKGLRIAVDGGRHITFPVYIRDVAQAVLLAMKRGRAGERYNICGDSLSHAEVNAIVSRLAGISEFRLNVPGQLMVGLAGVWTRLAEITGREPYYPINLKGYVFYDWPVCVEKARRELGFVPTPFEEGARRTVDWYRELGLIRR